MTYKNKIKSILGVDVRARYLYHNEDDLIHDPFKYPIIHKQINGKEIVPLDLVRFWQK
ncbi:hypothetical protein [Neobacillus vireti]|uniref:hypothetical protein n=1 Tax=Neobacillus vireti TaxID=220686 RepID=UPI002FFD8DCC